MSKLWRNFLWRVGGRLKLRVVYAGPEGHPRARHPTDAPGDVADTPLFERYRIGSWPFGRCTAYLHHYLRSDPDTAPHNHPWPWAIVIPLAGGYFERRPVTIDATGMIMTDRWRRPFLPYLLTAATFHRVIVRPGTTNWSLFIHGPRTQGWGFLRSWTVDLPFFRNSQIQTALYFEPAIDKTSSAALGHAWSKSAMRGYEMKRRAPP